MNRQNAGLRLRLQPALQATGLGSALPATAAADGSNLIDVAKLWLVSRFAYSFSSRICPPLWQQAATIAAGSGSKRKSSPQPSKWASCGTAGVCSAASPPSA
jgi:hypothetical protein